MVISKNHPEAQPLIQEFNYSLKQLKEKGDISKIQNTKEDLKPFRNQSNHLYTLNALLLFDSLKIALGNRVNILCTCLNGLKTFKNLIHNLAWI